MARYIMPGKSSQKRERKTYEEKWSVDNSRAFLPPSRHRRRRRRRRRSMGHVRLCLRPLAHVHTHIYPPRMGRGARVMVIEGEEKTRSNIRRSLPPTHTYYESARGGEREKRGWLIRGGLSSPPAHSSAIALRPEDMAALERESSV